MAFASFCFYDENSEVVLVLVLVIVID